MSHITNASSPSDRPHSSEFPLRIFFDCITDTFTAVSAPPNAPERVVIQPKATPLVDPDRSYIELVGHLHHRINAASKASRLESKRAFVADLNRLRCIPSAQQNSNWTKYLIPHNRRIAACLKNDSRTNQTSDAVGLSE